MKFVQVHDEKSIDVTQTKGWDTWFVHNIYLRFRAIKLHQKLWFGDLEPFPMLNSLPKHKDLVVWIADFHSASSSGTGNDNNNKTVNNSENHLQ